MAENGKNERRPRFGLMLLSLLLLLAITPCLSQENRTTTRVGVTILFSIILLAAVYALSETKRSMILAGTAALLVIVLQWYVTVFPNDDVQGAMNVFGILFLAYTVAIIMRHLLTCRRVTADTIYASLCAYLLLGIAWSLGYSLIDVLDHAAETAIREAADWGEIFEVKEAETA